MTIYGQNFDTTTDYNNNETNPRVTIGGKECEVVGSSNTTIECLTPGHVSGEAIVVVHIPGRGLGILFEYLGNTPSLSRVCFNNETLTKLPGVTQGSFSYIDSRLTGPLIIFHLFYSVDLIGLINPLFSLPLILIV